MKTASVRGTGVATVDAVLADLPHACRVPAGQLAPFLPGAAAAVDAACAPVNGRLPPPRPLFARLDR